MAFNCDHGVYLGQGCHYCHLQNKYRESSRIYGIRIGIKACADIIRKAASIDEALKSIEELKPDEM